MLSCLSVYEISHFGGEEEAEKLLEFLFQVLCKLRQILVSNGNTQS